MESALRRLLGRPKFAARLLSALRSTPTSETDTLSGRSVGAEEFARLALMSSRERTDSAPDPCRSLCCTSASSEHVSPVVASWTSHGAPTVPNNNRSAFCPIEPTNDKATMNSAMPTAYLPNHPDGLTAIVGEVVQSDLDHSFRSFRSVSAPAATSATVREPRRTTGRSPVLWQTVQTAPGTCTAVKSMSGCAVRLKRTSKPPSPMLRPRPTSRVQV